jgi:hypothetical protein
LRYLLRHRQQVVPERGCTSACTELSDDLIDELYRHCISRSGTSTCPQVNTCSAAVVQCVLLELLDCSVAANCDIGQCDDDMDAILRRLGDDPDADVPHHCFAALIRDALTLRKSREVRRFDETAVQEDDANLSLLGLGRVESCASASAPTRELVAAPCAWMRALGMTTSPLSPWASLPSWSLELSRFSIDVNAVGYAKAPPPPPIAAPVTPDLHDMSASAPPAPPPPAPPAPPAPLEIAPDAKSLGAAEHWRVVTASLGTLCELAVDPNLAHDAQDEKSRVRVALLQELRGELALFVRCYAAEARARLQAVHVATGHLLEQRQRDIDDLTAQLKARDLEAASRSSASTTATVGALNIASTIATSTCADLRHSASPKDNAQTQCAQPLMLPLPSSDTWALARAVAAEKSLQRELVASAVPDEAKHCDEEQVVASGVRAMQDRLAEMHGGTWFEKVAFRIHVRQPRYVRLSFDLRRVEWGHNARGPYKTLPVDAILRVEFGRASRAFQGYEFGRLCSRPPPAGRCLSITTASRSLDLIASSEREVEVWMLGLSEVIPHRPERQRLSTQDFLLRRALLRLEEEQPDGDGAPSTTRTSDSGYDGGSSTNCKRSNVFGGRSTFGAAGFRRMLTRSTRS